MSESILNALIHLFAIVANINPGGVTAKGRKIVESYLSRNLTPELMNEYLRLFDNYYDFYQRELDNDEVKDLKDSESLISFQILNVCRKIKQGLLREERVSVFLYLLEFVYEDHQITDQEYNFIKVVSKSFSFSDKEFNNLTHFIFEGTPEKLDGERVLVIDNRLREWSDSLAWIMKKSTSQSERPPYKHLFKQNLYGQIVIFYIRSIQSFILKYLGEQSLFIDGQRIKPGKTYFLNRGAVIKGPHIEPIYYYDIVSKFIAIPENERIVFSASELSFKFRNSKNGIQKFNFSEKSGQMIAVMGGSGVGKSTLFNLLSGKIKPKEGTVKINNYNVHSWSDSLTGVIGFVPQDDLLFEELTVFQNLYYNARLCFSDYSEQQIIEKVNTVLIELDLYDTRDLQVGTPLNKFISGGQRKRLNIALELMREPSILFVDEPTSGLSSMDSDKIMNLLKQQALSGKLIIANIHQPSSDIFKMFDKLWILDKGGYPIYQGNPVDAIVYFKTVTSVVNAAESQCSCCGNINPDEILRIVEDREIDEYGKQTRKRKTSPETWYYRYIENIEKRIQPAQANENIPATDFRVPNFLKQFKVFFMRSVLSKLTNKQYLLINTLEAPLLALILGYFSKYVTNTGYVFGENKNFPVFLFMSVVVALFLGLIVSAEEIIKDRKILERESFLRLSWFSYINSKIVILFAISALQTLLYVAIGNTILEVEGMLFPFWLILFSAACVGNLVGLNISSGLDSVIAIYIIIPLILVPQLLLGGAMIHFDDLNPKITNKTYVPLIGNMMTTRWAYEALAVQQFKKNKFEKLFFDQEQIISNAEYKTSFLIPELQSRLQLCMRRKSSDVDSSSLVRDLKLIYNELELISQGNDIPPFEYLHLLNYNDFDESVFDHTYGYLFYLDLTFSDLAKKANELKEGLYQKIVDETGNAKFVAFKQQHYNKKLADIVLNRNEITKILDTDKKLVQKKDPIFMEPTSRVGRAHFYAPVKIIHKTKIDTLWYNFLIMWLTCGILYILLYFDVLRRIIKYLVSLNLKEKFKKVPELI